MVRAQQLPHLFWEHVLGVRVDLAERDERDIWIGSCGLSLIERLLILILVMTVAFLVGERPSGVGPPYVCHRRDSTQTLHKLVLAMLRERL